MIGRKFIGFTLNFFAMLFIFTIAGCVNQNDAKRLGTTASHFQKKGEYESSEINIAKFCGIDVRKYGAVGDGIHDDTDAIQKCITTVERGSSRFYHETTYPEIVFPEGTYLISRPIVISYTNNERGLSIKGLGKVTIKQKNPDCDILYIHNGFRHVIDNISFDGGKRQIKFFTGNKDTSHLLVRNCRFLNSSSYAIDDALKGVHHSKIVPPYKIKKVNGLPVATATDVDSLPDIFYASTLLTVENCDFRNCRNVLRAFADWGVMRDSTIVTNPEMKGAAIYSRGVLKIENVHGLAHVKKGNNQRWIDNIMAGVMLQNVVFDSADQIGMCPVFNRRIYDNGGLYNVYVVVDGCKFNAARSPENCVVYCEEFPNLVAVRNTIETSGDTIPALNFRPKITKKYLQYVSFPELVKRDSELARIYGYMVKMPRIYSDVVGYKYKNNFSISINDNKNLTSKVPEVLKQFIEPPLPASIQKGFERANSPLNSQTMDSLVMRKINVRDYGALPNGKNATSAIQKAFDSAKKNPFTEVVFPNGVYRVSKSIKLPKNISIRGLGMACFRGNGKINTLFTGEDILNLSLRNLGFFKVGNAVDVKTRNEDESRILIDMCLFTQLTGSGLICMSGKGEPMEKNNTSLRIVNCVYVRTKQALCSNANDARFDCNWISTARNVKNGSPFVNKGQMSITDIIGVPGGTYGRWIENYGTLHMDNFRFGGEGHWKNNIIDNKSSNAEIFIENSWLNCEKEVIVNCFTLPAILALRCNLGIPATGFQKMVKLPIDANLADLDKVLYETANIPPTIIVEGK